MSIIHKLVGKLNWSERLAKYQHDQFDSKIRKLEKGDKAAISSRA